MDSGPSKLKVGIGERDGVAVISLSGRLDAVTSPQAQRELEHAVAGNPRLLVDCTDLSYLSSAGLRAIVIAHRNAVDGGGKLALHVPGTEVMQTITISGVNRVIPIHSTLDGALAQLR